MAKSDWLPAPPKLKGPSPTLRTVYRVFEIIRAAEEGGELPISLEEIKRRMGAKGVRHATIQNVLAHLEWEGSILRTRDGPIWILASPSAKKALARLGIKA